MLDLSKKNIRKQPRFGGIFDEIKYPNGCFEKEILISSVPKFDEVKEYLSEAYASDCDGTQLCCLEDELSDYTQLPYALAVSSGQVALQLALKLAAEKLYGSSSWIKAPHGFGRGGALSGEKCFCPNFVSADRVNPVVFEGGEPVFIDLGDPGVCMDPEVLRLAWQKYPDVKIVIYDHAYGFPGDVLSIRKLCNEHNAIMIECVSDAFGAEYRIEKDTPDGKSVMVKAGVMGDYAVLDFAGDKIIGYGGGALLMKDDYSYRKANYWATGAMADVPWYEHDEIGMSCAMSDTEAAVIRGQLLHLDEIIEKKKAIFERYYEKLNNDLAYIVPVTENTKPNYWLTVMTAESSIQFNEVRNDRRYVYQSIHGIAAPMEIYDALQAFGADCTPVYKPMSMQPVYKNYEYFTLDGPWRMYESFDNDNFSLRCDRARAYYESGICLPCDVSMTEEEQDIIISIIIACYDKPDLNRLARV